MKLIDVAWYLVNISTYSIVIPVGFGMYYLKTLSIKLKILLLGLCITLLLDLFLLFFSARATNTFLYIFTAVDVLTIAWVFNLSITSHVASSFILFMGFLFIPLIILDALFLSGIKNKGDINSLEDVFVLIATLYFMTQLFREEIESNLLKLPMFWVCLGAMAYHLVGAFDIFSDQILNYSQNLYLQYYMFWSIVTIFMYGSFAYSFWLCQSRADA